MQGPFLRKYATQATVDFVLYKIDGTAIQSAATFDAGDVKVMLDEAAEANATNLPTDEGQTYSIVVTAAQMTAARIAIILVDQTSPQLWLDTYLVIETYGHASAQHAFDLSTASTAQTGDSFTRLGAPTGASVSADVADLHTDVANNHTDIGTAIADVAAVHVHVGTIDGHITADYGATEKACVDLLDDAAGGLADIHTDVGAVKTDTAAILLDTGTDGVIVASLGATAKSDVNAEVVDALNVDTYAEPGQGAPAATASLAVKIGALYKSWRNKLTQTATTLSVYNDAGDTVDQKATVSDDGDVYTRGEIGSGP